MSNPKMEELIKILNEKGLKQEEVADIRLALLQDAYEAFMDTAMQSLTDDDLQKIEDAPTQEEANTMLRTLYKEKTGKDAEEEMGKVLDQKAQELLEQHQGAGAPLTDGGNPTTDAAEIAKAEDELHKIAEETHDPVKAADPTNWQ